MTSVLIADNHAYYRTGLRQALETQAGFTIIAEAETGAEALALARLHLPDLLLVSVHLPDLSGLHVARALEVDHPLLSVILLTLFTPAVSGRGPLPANVRRVLAKDSPTDTLVEAIRAVSGESL